MHIPDEAVEEWRDIPGWEGLYRVSSAGRIFSIRKQQIIKSHLQSTGRQFVSLYRAGKGKNMGVHRIVCEAFHGPPQGKQECNHIDGDPLNNTPGNLEWCSRSYNQLHAIYLLGHLRKRVACYDQVTGEKIAEYPSMASAEEFGFDSGKISQCVSGKRKLHGGLKWLSLEDEASYKTTLKYPRPSTIALKEPQP
ncbi:NUMOD4 domain-containing protein [Pseudoxanthomonas sp. X-1]|uniref:NUMOD4 domain-containing protein n=1 Tax=Pseudoxanthomonas sp. X-1 TaxID=2571115 RepID=UPI00110BD5F2|nr:NUMOD4 domain-containing protein [Pseudoxanthomonas sp. X-1]TMN18499.1 hypothetical protein FF950_14560 [Pseudoxanthomonas sp. X-1]UAY75994.1 HNH endonuclease [Pseudoxanthomonas sp. X-1]